MSAAFTGVVGGVYAHWFGYIEPAAVFDMTMAVKVFVMMLLGGSATVFGPLYGAFMVELIGLVVWSRLLTFHTAVLGLIIIAVVIFVPGGLAGLAGRRLSVHVLLTNIRENRL
jgi:branched-chain amino acid transport system permease protein